MKSSVNGRSEGKSLTNQPPSFSNPNEQAFNSENSGAKSTIQDKFGWLDEIEKIIKQMLKFGIERIPDEFKIKTDYGVVVWLRDIDKQVQNHGLIGERLGIILSEQAKKPILLGFADADNKDSLWNSGRWHQRTFEEFTKDIVPFDIEWLYGSWQRAIDMAYLLLPDDKVDAKLLQACRNQEIRKWLVKRYGQENFKNGKGKLIDEEIGDDGKKTGQYLFDIDIDGQPHRFVKVNDTSTNREYILEVPSEGQRRRGETDFPIKNVKEAIAWTFSMKPNEYHPTVET